jgi:predicted RNA binding protein YcfA (HicA-like mRNA interferase family)
LKLPRDLSGERLAAALRRVGYEVTRPTGSHVRLTTTVRGEHHHVTIPRHVALRVGTLASVLADVAQHLELDRDELLKRLFD